MRTVFRSVGILLVVAALLAFLAPASYADKEASATRRLVASIPPSIGVGGGPAGAPLPFPQPPARVRILIPFQIDANSQVVRITVCVTNFYKADDPKSDHFIVVDRSREVSVSPANGIERGDGSNSLPYSTRTCTIGNTPGFETVPGDFESSQRGVFSQQVIVDPTWIRPGDAKDLELPVGEYSALVRLTARIDP